MNLNFTNWRLGRYLYLWCALLFSGTLTSFAQERPVSGKIVAEDGSELAGVNVTVKGSGRGVISDASGNYKINVDGPTSVLVFSFIGFDTQEVTVGTRSIVNVSLVTSAESLNEVVVTALGIRREERSLGYSVGKVDGKDLSRITNENVLTGLAGRVPGVAISSTGTTGSSVSMIVVSRRSALSSGSSAPGSPRWALTKVKASSLSACHSGARWFARRAPSRSKKT
ncbi:MAG: carboxypeptidase-like regulatory domain-containing protein, partial [Leadbetterella sp.]|nr:carboxypeptidase-like regulatory domain-containing protein [Leadbetterella sp.]